MTSVLKTDTTYKNFDKKPILSGDEIVYLYELEGRCDKIDLIEKFKNDRETVQGLKANSPVLIYFHETGEVVDDQGGADIYTVPLSVNPVNDPSFLITISSLPG